MFGKDPEHFFIKASCKRYYIRAIIRLKDISVIRLVALDIDGTVLNSRHALSPIVRDTIRLVRAAGIPVCLATGKLFAGVRPLVDELLLTGPQITGNGGATIEAQTGDLIASNTLTSQQLADSLRALATCAPDVAIAWYTHDTIFSDAAYGFLDKALAPYHEPSVQHIASFRALPLPIKLLIATEPQRLDQIRVNLETALEPHVKIVRTAIDFLECMNPAINKGQALTQVMSYYGVHQAEVLAIGDGENDISLLEVSGVRIAMGNADPRLIPYAQHMTATNDEDGVAMALRRFVLDEILQTDDVME